MRKLLFIFFATIAVNLLQAQTSEKKLYIQGNYQKLITLCGPKLEIEDISNSEAKYLGLSYQNLFQHQPAIMAFQRVLSDDPKNTEARVYLGNSYRALGRVNEALDQYQTAYKKDTTNAQIAGLLGAALMETGQNNEAFLHYQSWAQKDSLNPYWSRQLGIAAYKAHKLKEAIAAFKLTLDLNPKDWPSRKHLVAVFKKKKEYNRALTILQEGKALFPDNKRIEQYEAEILFLSRDYKKAQTVYSSLIQRGDTSFTNIRNWGICNYFTANYKQALQTLEPIYYVIPNDPNLAFYVGLSYNKMGNKPRAVEFLEAAIESATPTYIADYFHHKASILNDMRKFSQSIEAYKKAYEYDPSKKKVLLSIATTMEEMDSNKTKALVWYNEFLKEADPDKYPKSVKYAENRVEFIRGELHMAQ